MWAVLGDQYIFDQRTQLAVMLELTPTVVSLGGVGRDLDDQNGIQQSVEVRIVELGFAASHHYVRVGI